MFDVENFNPRKESQISDNDDIYIQFTKDINKATLVTSVMIVEDKSGNISDMESLFDADVLGVPLNIKYDAIKRTVYLKPKQVLEEGNRYVVIVTGNIESIDGEKIKRSHFIPFYVKKSVHAPVIMYPTNTSIVECIDRVEFNGSGIARLQISSDVDFSNILLDVGVDARHKVYMMEKVINTDGMYYIRCTCSNVFSDICQVYVLQKARGISSVSCDNLFISDEKGSEEVCKDDIKVTLTPDNTTRVYTSYNSLLIEVDDKDVQIELSDVSLLRVFDALSEEYLSEEVSITDVNIINKEEKSFIIIRW